MHYIPDIEILTLWLNQYGSIALFFLLALGIIALPVPDETLMVIAGIFMKKGDLNIHSTLIAAYLGSMVGITLSYVIGMTAGFYLLHKYGGWFGVTDERLQKAHQWFEKYGKWTLTFGYFIPGIRHFTGVSAGVAKLEYHYFALFAYTGALLWVTTFLSIGYFFGSYGVEKLADIEIKEHWVTIIGVLGIIAGAFWWYRKSK